ncbi:AbrB/MazE/SpoVT family DNA-binding domain-containing protein [Arcobacter sp. CECT 8985]|uniref:AbrB/MazE/SpoVT family DNA-binding domain-containing protein n=1 Tax=Arcobacter sp. CECT 8985 TaxID=1935424 RepID=UPI00100C0666|nr:AbrB/MazE/SpoVT family DNA-binding domain-containing protein [Arcobacter sp. CECT 8985]RXJ86855.1 hypothetical protein CRU93_06540 [Arcobacter sp. CECT 8985]
MEIKIIKIGSSKGIRIPSKVLKEFNNPDGFKLNMTEYGIFLKPYSNNIRDGWKEAYKKSNSCALDKKEKL